MSEAKTNNDGSGALAWMAKNGVAANVLMIFLLVGGIIMAKNVKQEVFPEFTIDVVRISVPYPGASPAEVEKGILLSIEDVVRGLQGVRKVTSSASEGSGSVIVELLTSANAFKTFQDVKNEVDRITSFPEDAEQPVVSLVESRRKVVSVVVYGDQEQLRLRNLAERIRDDLAQRPGITLVELGLSPPLEIAIEIPQEVLRSYNLTLEAVAQKLRDSAIELPAGEVRAESGQILLRTYERRNFGREFLDIPIATAPDGTLLRLRDIATVNDGFEEADQEAQFNGHPAVLIDVYRVGDETPQGVSAAVEKYIAELQPQLPKNVHLTSWNDASVMYRDRIHLLLKNALLGLTLVLLLLGLFLEVRLAFWVTLGIPISILGSFLFLPMTGTSINMISLFAFIITLGIIVDDAVVVGENVYEYRERGLSPLQAAIRGVRDISTPVFFAVLTNILAFFPLFFVPGVTGRLFRQIPSVVVIVFAISLVESLFILPAHLSHTPGQGRIWKFLNRPKEICATKLQEFTETYYLPCIRWIVERRYLAIALALSTLMISIGVVAGNHLKFTFLPRIDSDLITVQAVLPFGSPIAESRDILSQIIKAAERTIDENGGSQIAKGVYSQIGGSLLGNGPGPATGLLSGSHVVAVQVSLVTPDLREIRGNDFRREWEKNIGTLVGLESLTFKAETGTGNGAP
ncbi:MAG: efflux RND transporter permease subunit, partial [Bdellovibrionales bacterium]|nr:efflux RND transporter permease subunit [Bdellovibrionales bacterium]